MNSLNTLTNTQTTGEKTRNDKLTKIEKFMIPHNHLEIVYSDKMPYRLKGYCSNGVIFLNPERNKTKAETIVTLSEEVGHDITGVGNIREQKTIDERKQENKARRWGYRQLVTLDDLIYCYEKGCKYLSEIAMELEITTECLENALEDIRVTMSCYFKYNGYYFRFVSDTNLQITKPNDIFIFELFK